MASLIAEVIGSINVQPNSGQTLQGAVTLQIQALKQSATKYESGIITGTGIADAVLAMGQVANAKLVVIQKAQSASISFKFSTQGAADQVLPIGRIFVWDCADKPITAIKYTGSGDFEFLLVEW